VIHLGRARNPRWFFWLPFLFAIWVNCHASFMLGLIVAAVVWGNSLLSFKAGSLLSPRWMPERRRSLGIALSLSVASVFLNPVGWRQVLYPLTAMLNMPLMTGSVAEFGPLPMSSGRGIALMAIVLFCSLLVMMQRAEIYLDEAMLLALGTWLAMNHVRMLFVFGILAAPIVARQTSAWWSEYTAESDRPGLNAAMIASALAAAYLAFPSSSSLQAQVERTSPVKAVEYIRANHLSGPMLNAHGFGGYLIWAAPEHPVFVDGRTDVFEWTGVLKEFGEWATLKSDPDTLLNKYGVSFCLLNRESPMVRVLPLLPDWKILYADSNSVIIARTSALGAEQETAQYRLPN